MNKVTDYIKAKYKGHKYNLAMYVSLSVDASDHKTVKLTIKKAGFQTTNKALKIGDISLTASFTNLKGELKKYSHVAPFNQKRSSGDKYVRQRYLGEKTLEFNRLMNEDRDVIITFKGNMRKTRFSGKNIIWKYKLHIPAIAKPTVNIDVEPNSTTPTSVDISLKISADDTLKVMEPTIKRYGTETLSCTWKYNGTTISFGDSGHTMEKKTVTYTTTVANQITDKLHDTMFNCNLTVGEFSGLTDSDSIPFEIEPIWYGQLVIEGTNENPMPYPKQNKDGTAKIKVYSEKNGDFIEVINRDGWQTHEISSTSWAVDIALNELYVYSEDTPIGTSAKANLKVVYSVPTESNDSEQQLAIFETSRNCGYTTGLANNIFIGGCKYENYKSRVWYSAVNNPTFIPDTNYIEVGTNDTSVMGIVKVGDYLGIIKQSKTTDSSVYLTYATSFEDNTAFATKPCINGVGAIGEFCFNVLGDETLFLSPRGVMAIVPSEDEQSRVKNRSYFVDGALLSEPNIEDAYSFVYDGKYFLFVNNNAYVLDGSQRNSWGNERTNLVYECYYLENVPVKCAVTFDELLMFSDFDGNICIFKDGSDDDPYTDEKSEEEKEPVYARWSTIADDDGSVQYHKTMKKKGTLVSLLPETNTTADVSVKKDEEEERYIGRKEIGEGHTLPSEFFIKKKVKKYKRLQFIVEDSSAHPFGINKIVKAYSFGSYARR